MGSGPVSVTSVRPSRPQSPRAASRRRWHLPHPLAARPILARVGADRRLGPAVVLALILVASLAAALPASGAAIGGTNGAGDPDQPADRRPRGSGRPVRHGIHGRLGRHRRHDVPRAPLLASMGDQDAPTASDYTADGTLLAPYAVAADTRQLPGPGVRGEVGRHAHRHRQPLRPRHDDDLVGQQADGQGPAPRRPEAADPARGRRALHGGRGRHRRVGRGQVPRQRPGDHAVRLADVR